MNGHISARTRHSSEQGSALIVTMLISVLALGLGMGLMMLGETESFQSKAFLEHQRAKAAARDVVEMAAAWFTTPTDRIPQLPPPTEWITDLRRGDMDGDRRADAACDGSRDGGAWTAWPVIAPDLPPASRLVDAVRSACGTATHPDLLLTEGNSPFLAEMAATLGADVVIERISVQAAPALHLQGARASALEVNATIVLRRGAVLVARTTATAHVRAIPSLASSDVISAGGDVTIQAGAAVHWGRVACDGNIDLPSLDGDAFPFSGLPRQPDGSPMSFAPGGPVDWSLSTSRRECLLTELTGRTKNAAWVLSQDMVAPSLPDPWLSFAAGRAVRAGGKSLGRATDRQPRPFDARWTDLGHDLSHLSAGWALRAAASAPGRASAVQELGAALARTGSGVRRFVLDPSWNGSGEPLWREGGLGPTRTAAQWITESEAPLMAAFVTGGARSPANVTIRSGRGLVLFEAQRVTVMPPDSERDAALHVVTMPGEPFLDTGIDADGDGQIDPGTAGNGHWDADIDDDGVADQGPPKAWMFEAQVLPVVDMPSYDNDPALLESMPHEAFLNLDYPVEDAGEPVVRVRYGAGMAGTSREVRDLDGDGFLRPGVDRFTSAARDDEGARQARLVGFAGLVACLGGDIVVSAGGSVHGALRATGSVSIETGASVTFDAGLERDGAPSDQSLPVGVLGDVAWVAGVIVDPLRPAARSRDDAGGRGADAGGADPASPDGPGQPGSPAPRRPGQPAASWGPRNDRPMESSH